MSVQQTTGLTDDSHISSALSSNTRHALPVAAGRRGNLETAVTLHTLAQASNSSRGSGTWNLAGSKPLGFTDAKEARLNQRQKRMHDEDVCIYTCCPLNSYLTAIISPSDDLRTVRVLRLPSSSRLVAEASLRGKRRDQPDP